MAWYYWVGATVVAVPFLMRLFHRLTSGRFSDLKHYNLNGRVFVVTGATSGIGEVTTFELYNRGATVVLLCRDTAKAERMIARMMIEQPLAIKGGKLSVIECKLDNLESVRLAARQLLLKHERIDVLINNAGQGGQPGKQRTVTCDNFEQTMAANYFGHLLLSVLLLDRLQECKPSRIVNVSSMLYAYGYLDVDNINFDSIPYDKALAYNNSKLAQVMMTRYMANKLAEKKSGITVTVLHPGVVGTPIVKYFPGGNNQIVRFLFQSMAKTPLEGAQTTLYLAVADEAASSSGKYFADCAEKAVSGQAADDVLCETLWKKSCELVNIKNPFS